MSFLAALLVTLGLTPLARWAGLALGIVDRPGELKIHRLPVPLLGGVAVILSTLAVHLVLGTSLPRPIFGGVVVALGAGLADDIRPLPPWLRGLLLVAAGALMVSGGLRLTPLGPLEAAGAVFLVAACANAVNIMDGQDGLAGGLSAIAALGLSGLSALENDSTGVALGLALAGSLAGFLFWNRPPARIFLGNGGAYAVGAVLAVLAARNAQTAGWSGLIAAGSCLGLFALELLLTVTRRARGASPVTTGDRLHSYDLLAKRATRESVTLAFWVLGALFAAGAAVISRAPPEVSAPTVGALALAALWWGSRLSALPRSPSRR